MGGGFGCRCLSVRYNQVFVVVRCMGEQGDDMLIEFFLLINQLQGQ